MEKSDCRVGMEVYFGRKNGEKTLGKVIKMNLKKAQIETLESRGHGRGSTSGTPWGVPYSMMTPKEDGPSVRLQRQPNGTVFGTIIKNSFPSSADTHILAAISQVENELSPENLTCDGELLPAYVQIKKMKLESKLRLLKSALEF